MLFVVIPFSITVFFDRFGAATMNDRVGGGHRCRLGDR
jgi:hypothetical protein